MVRRKVRDRLCKVPPILWVLPCSVVRRDPKLVHILRRFVPPVLSSPPLTELSLKLTLVSSPVALPALTISEIVVIPFTVAHQTRPTWA